MSESNNSIQQHSARVRRNVSILWIVCATLVVLERFSAATIAAVHSHFAQQPVLHLACQAVSAIPEFLFLIGLWGIRDTLGAFARGELFGPRVTRMLDRVGTLLAVASLIELAIVPGVCRLLGFDNGYWIAFDPSAIVLAGLGLALKAIAGVLRRASKIETELDGIF